MNGMSSNPGDEEAIRRLLDESDVEATPELTDALRKLRTESRGEAPAPCDELEALFTAGVTPLRKSRRRGFLLGGAVIAAMAAGTTGVAANGDFWVTAETSHELPAPVHYEQIPAPAPAPETPAPTDLPDSSADPAPAAETIPDPEAVPSAEAEAEAEAVPSVPAAPAVPAAPTDGAVEGPSEDSPERAPERSEQRSGRDWNQGHRGNGSENGQRQSGWEHEKRSGTSKDGYGKDHGERGKGQENRARSGRDDD